MATVTLLGREFQAADKVGLMPLLRFAHFAKHGADTEDIEAMVAMYDVLRSVVADSDWEAFQQHATDTRADQTELLEAVKAAIAAITARPTQRPSDFSDGSLNPETSSLDNSSSVVFSTDDAPTSSPNIHRTSPLLDDPRVVELQPIHRAAELVTAASR